MYFTDAMESISSPMEYEYRNSKKIFELKYGTTQSDETLDLIFVLFYVYLKYFIIFK